MVAQSRNVYVGPSCRFQDGIVVFYSDFHSVDNDEWHRIRLRMMGFYQECEIAPDLHTTIHGRAVVLFPVGLHGPHSYFSFFFLSWATIAKGSSFIGSFGSSSTISKTLDGQALRHAPQASHFSVSMVMK